MVGMNRQTELVVINKVLAVLVVVLAFSTGLLLAERQSWTKDDEAKIAPESKKALPLPDFDGIMVMEPKKSALAELLRRARYQPEIETTETIGRDQLLALVWAAQGQITDWGERTAPSYKSQFPLRLKVWINQVEDIDPGWYVFEPEGQQLIPMDDPLPMPQNGAAAMMVVSPKEDTQAANQMIWYESGEVAQNILLMGQELDLETSFTLAQQSQDLWTISIGRVKR